MESSASGVEALAVLYLPQEQQGGVHCLQKLDRLDA